MVQTMLQQCSHPSKISCRLDQLICLQAVSKAMARCHLAVARMQHKSLRCCCSTQLAFNRFLRFGADAAVTRNAVGCWPYSLVLAKHVGSQLDPTIN